MARKTKAVRLTGAQIDQLLHLSQPALNQALEQLTGAQIDQLLHLSDAIRKMQLMEALATADMHLRTYWLLQQDLLSTAEVLQLAKDAGIHLPPEVVASYKQHKFPESDDDEG
jgi:hypothetical protein